MVTLESSSLNKLFQVRPNLNGLQGMESKVFVILAKGNNPQSDNLFPVVEPLVFRRYDTAYFICKLTIRAARRGKDYSGPFIL